MINQNLLLADGGYNLTKSLRFRSSASAYLNRTPASATNRKTWTLSAWVKRGNLASDQMLFASRPTATPYALIYFATDNTLNYAETGLTLTTSQVFRDPSSWYHIVLTVDTTQATASNRLKMYVNGIQITSFSTATYPTLNYDTQINTATNHTIGRGGDYVTSASNYFDGYMAEMNFIDGQALTPSSFGSTNALTGVWQPTKYNGTYGTNGFYLPFTNTSSVSALGTDFSGNSNTWTVNNISITNNYTYDSMTDVPTLTNGNIANYAVLSPLTGSSVTPTPINGNLTISTTTIGQFYGQVYGFRTSQTKFYFEVQQQQGAVTASYFVGARLGDFGAIPFYAADGSVGGVSGSAGATYTNSDVIGLALDPVNATIEFFKNGTSQGGSRTITGGAGEYYPFISVSDGGTRVLCHCNFGQRPFAYTPPTGFVALNTFNLPTPTIGATSSSLANKYFDATTYSGSASAQNIVNAGGFQPDFVWVKSRSDATGHILEDSVRGALQYLGSESTAAESTIAGTITSFNSNGFGVGTQAGTNFSGRTFVGWQWRAGQGSTSSNTNGSITSTTSVNASAGFSVVTYTGTGANATVGHGLGVAPSMIIVKSRNVIHNWPIYHKSLGNAQGAFLNLTNAANSQPALWNSTTPTSSVFSVGTDTETNQSTTTYVAYCWSEIADFSKFGSYTGNGSADGPFVYLGFRPRFVLIKRTDTTANWEIIDTARDSYNTCANYLYPNLSDAEANAPSNTRDYLSNGFKIRHSGSGANASGGTYIYMAFAENPMKYSLGR